MKRLGLVLAGVVVGFLVGTAVGSWSYGEDLKKAGLFAQIGELFSSSESAYMGRYGWKGAIIGAVLGLLVGSSDNKEDGKAP